MLLATFAATLGTRSAARADASFTGVAVADGLDVTVTPGYQALGDTFDSGAFVAEAKLDAIGESKAYASHPYPGNIVAGEAGANYPFFVYSSYPDHPNGSQSQPVSTLTAESTLTSSRAAASGTPSLPGVATGATSSTASAVLAVDGSVTVTSDVDVQGLTVAGALSIADIHGHATIKRDSAGHVTRGATLSIGSASVGGVPVTITSDGVVVAGNTVPVTVPTDTVNQTLSAAGVSVQEIAGSTSDTGATAPALAINVTKDVPNVGPVDAHYLVGFAKASLTATAIPAGSGSPAGPGPPTLPSARRASTAASSRSTPVISGSTSTPGLSGVPTGAPLNSGDAVTAAAPVVAPEPASGTATTQLAAARRPLPRPYSWISLYVIAVAACGLALGGGLLVRQLGVRAR